MGGWVGVGGGAPTRCNLFDPVFAGGSVLLFTHICSGTTLSGTRPIYCGGLNRELYYNKYA